MKTLVSCVFMLLLFSSAAAAQNVDGCNSEAYLVGGGQCFLIVCPQGDGTRFDDPLFCGSYIRIIVRDSAGAGIPGIIRSDYWVQACDDPDQSVCYCNLPDLADSLTNEDGMTTISGAIHGGGCVESFGIYIAVQGISILQSPSCQERQCIDVIIRSPDLNADCAVTLSDLPLFGSAYGSSLGDPNFNPCCDYNNDGQITLSDLAEFGVHYQAIC